LRVNDGEGESGGDGGVNGVASRLHDFCSCARSEFVDAGYDGMRRMRWTQGRGREAGGQKRGERG
jgi:hypothetical protein